MENMTEYEYIPLPAPADTLLIGDQVRWGVRATLDGPAELVAEPLQGTVVPGVEVVDGWRMDTLSVRKGRTEVEIRAVLTSFDSGSYVVPGRELYLRRADGALDTLRLGDLPLEVTTVPVDTAGFTPCPLKGQADYPVTFAEVASWAGGALCAGLLVWALLAAWKRARNRRAGTVSRRPADPPHIVALRELERIRTEKLWQGGKDKLFYTAVTDALRRYMEGRYGVSAMESTSAEIIALLRDRSVPEAEYRDLQELFRTADLVKFAKSEPTEQEREQAIPAAVRFVNATFLQTVEEEGKNE